MSGVTMPTSAGPTSTRLPGSGPLSPGKLLGLGHGPPASVSSQGRACSVWMRPEGHAATSLGGQDARCVSRGKVRKTGRGERAGADTIQLSVRIVGRSSGSDRMNKIAQTPRSRSPICGLGGAVLRPPMGSSLLSRVAPPDQTPLSGSLQEDHTEQGHRAHEQAERLRTSHAGLPSHSHRSLIHGAAWSVRSRCLRRTSSVCRRDVDAAGPWL
jgi:hypothetical protein